MQAVLRFVTALLVCGSAVARGEGVGALAGVYKRRLPSQAPAGSGGATEDLLEIVPVAEGLVYFKTSLAFFNGHSCELFGLAKAQPSGDLLFIDPEPRTHHCALRMHVGPKLLAFEDDSASPCRIWYCGERGKFTGVDFARSQKKPLRDLKNVVESLDYKSAVAGLTDPSRRPE